MTSEALILIDSCMKELGLNYAFLEWKGTPIYPYFTGEYSETDVPSEDGRSEATFILTGFSRTTALALEEAKEAIRRLFKDGKTAITSSGNGVAIFYSNAFPVPTEDAELKKIQINLIIKEWKVN